MSASLRWKHVPKPPVSTEDISLCHDLMHILRRRYWADGLLSREIEMTPVSLLYLQGLKDAGVADVDKLISVIREEGGVILYHEF